MGLFFNTSKLMIGDFCYVDTRSDRGIITDINGDYYTIKFEEDGWEDIYHKSRVRRA